MKLLPLAIFAALSFAGPTFAASPGEMLTVNAEMCVKNGAPRASALSSSLTDAVNFLVDDLCVVEIQHAETYAASARTLQDLQATTASAQLVGVSIDPNTGELKMPPGFSVPFNTNTLMANAMRGVATPRGKYRVIAAEAVLASKSARR